MPSKSKPPKRDRRLMEILRKDFHYWREGAYGELHDLIVKWACSRAPRKPFWYVEGAMKSDGYVRAVDDFKKRLRGA